MLWLTLFLLLLGVLSFWAGFKARKHHFQYLFKAGFIMTLLLSMLSGYFVLREDSTLSELAEIIEPLPQITDVTYIPTSSETSIISNMIEAAPSSIYAGDTTKERQQLADAMHNRLTEYWLISTSLAPEEIVIFYNQRVHRKNWELLEYSSSWIRMSRGDEELTLLISAKGVGESSVIYALKNGGVNR